MTERLNWTELSSPYGPGASLVAQTVKNLPAVQETWPWFLGQKDPLEKVMATHSSILAWRIPWTEEPGGLQSTGLQRVRHGWVINIFTFFLHPLRLAHGNTSTVFLESKSFKIESGPKSSSYIPEFLMDIRCAINVSWIKIVFVCVCVCVSHSVMSDSLRPHGFYMSLLAPGSRLLCPWNSSGKNTGVPVLPVMPKGCHSFLQN